MAKDRLIVLDYGHDTTDGWRTIRSAMKRARRHCRIVGPEAAVLVHEGDHCRVVFSCTSPGYRGRRLAGCPPGSG